MKFFLFYSLVLLILSCTNSSNKAKSPELVKSNKYYIVKVLRINNSFRSDTSLLNETSDSAAYKFAIRPFTQSIEVYKLSKEKFQSEPIKVTVLDSGFVDLKTKLSHEMIRNIDSIVKSEVKKLILLNYDNQGNPIRHRSASSDSLYKLLNGH